MLPLALTLAALFCGALAICFDAQGRRAAFGLCKPLPLVLLLVLVGAYAPAGLYGALILAALALSLIGDVLLLDKEKGFRGGLANFLLAHLVFAVAFVPSASGLGIGLGGLVLAAAGGYYAWLWPHLGRERLPVAVYVAAIAAMLLLALHQPSGLRGGLMLTGALLFAASDATLAWNRFRAPLPRAQLAILSSYYAAQAAFAWSALIA